CWMTLLKDVRSLILQGTELHRQVRGHTYPLLRRWRLTGCAKPQLFFIVGALPSMSERIFLAPLSGTMASEIVDSSVAVSASGRDDASSKGLLTLFDMATYLQLSRTVKTLCSLPSVLPALPSS